MLKVKRRDRVLWVEGTLLGVRVRKSTGLPVGSEREAERTRLGWEREIVEGTFGEETKRHDFGDAVVRYLRWKGLEGGVSEGTRRMALRFATLFAGCDVKSMTAGKIQETIEGAFAGLKPGSVRRYLNILNAVLAHAEEIWGLRLARAKRPRADDQRDVHFGVTEANRFLEWVREHEPHYWPHFVVLVDCGVRLNELLRLEKRDFEGGVLRVRRREERNGKTESRTIPLTKAVEHAIASLPESGPAFRKPSGVFPSANTASAYLGVVLRRGCEELGLRRLRVHDLRHTFAYLVAQNGADIADLQGLLGHEDISQTMRYRGFVASRGRAAVVSAREGGV